MIANTEIANCCKYCWLYTQQAGPFFLDNKSDFCWGFILLCKKVNSLRWTMTVVIIMTWRPTSLDSDWFRHGHVTQFWLMRLQANLMEEFLENFSLLITWKAREESLFFFSGCCWSVLQLQMAKNLQRPGSLRTLLSH